MSSFSISERIENFSAFKNENAVATGMYSTYYTNKIYSSFNFNNEAQKNLLKYYCVVKILSTKECL